MSALSRYLTTVAAALALWALASCAWIVYPLLCGKGGLLC